MDDEILSIKRRFDPAEMYGFIRAMMEGSNPCSFERPGEYSHAIILDALIDFLYVNEYEIGRASCRERVSSPV